MRLFDRHQDALPIAGGTDLMVAWNAGGLAGRTFLDVSPLRAWSRIRQLKDALAIGSLATHSELQRHPLLRRRFPLLAEACATVGGVQIQNRGTIGGNVANASPAGDTFPALAVYEATVVVVSNGDRREVPFLEFFTGPKRNCLAPGELVESLRIPFPMRPPTRAMFRKVGTRAAQAISKTVAAGLLWQKRDGTVAELRFALGSMAPTVRRLRHAEAFVKGRRLTPDVVREACALVSRDVVTRSTTCARPPTTAWPSPAISCSAS